MMVPLPEMVWKIIFQRIPHSNVALHWMPGTAANLCPLKVFFNFGKSQKSQGAAFLSREIMNN